MAPKRDEEVDEVRLEPGADCGGLYDFELLNKCMCHTRLSVLSLFDAMQARRGFQQASRSSRVTAASEMNPDVACSIVTARTVCLEIKLHVANARSLSRLVLQYALLPRPFHQLNKMLDASSFA